MRLEKLNPPAWVAFFLAAAVLSTAAPAAGENAGAFMSDVWARFRAAKSEREASEILVIASPQEGFYTREQVGLLLENPPGNVKHKRAVRRAVYDVEGVDKTQVLFSLPPEDAGLGLLIFSAVREPSDRMWLYMPGYRSVRQLPASNTQRFADTDLLYEDVRSQSGDRTALYEYSVERTEECAGRSCKVIAATPGSEVTTSYARKVFWVDSEWLFPIRLELYDRGGNLWKILQNSELHEAAPNIRRANLVEMRDLQRKSATVLVITQRQIGIDIPPQVFTQDSLQHPDAP